MSNMDVLGLIIKSTRKCNLQCSYCHDWRSQGESMSFEVMATLIAKALYPHEHHHIDFIWHGGEPLILGRKFYLKALYLQQRFRQEGQRIHNSLQTNGTLIDEKWCKFFKDFGFNIGISIDGREPVHNVNRKYSSGCGSFDKVKQGIHLLQKHKIPFGALTVITHETLKLDPEDFFNFFHDLGVKSFAFLAVRPDNVPNTGEIPTTDYVNNTEYVMFMKRIFDLWYDLDDTSIHIRELNGILNSLVGRLPSICTLAGNCLGQYFGVEPNGDIHHCDKFLGDPQYHLGNILKHSFREIRSQKRFHELAAKESKRIATCQPCPWFRVCNGGCPHDYYIASKHSVGCQETCCGLRELIEYIYERVCDDLDYIPLLTMK